MQINQWIRNHINLASFNVKYYTVPWATLEIFELILILQVFCFTNYMIGTNCHFKYFSLSIIKIILQFWGGNKICILLLHHIALPGHISSLRNYFGTCIKPSTDSVVWLLVNVCPSEFLPNLRSKHMYKIASCAFASNMHMFCFLGCLAWEKQNRPIVAG